MKLRLKWSEGQTKIQLDGTTLADLRAVVEDKTGVIPAAQRLFGGFPPTEMIAEDASVSLNSLGIMGGDQITLETKKVKVAVPSRPPTVCGTNSNDISVGSTVKYLATGELSTVVKVHYDDPPDPYYTILFSNGNERQTTHEKVELVDPKTLILSPYLNGKGGVC